MPTSNTPKSSAGTGSGSAIHYDYNNVPPLIKIRLNDMFDLLCLF